MASIDTRLERALNAYPQIPSRPSRARNQFVEMYLLALLILSE